MFLGKRLALPHVQQGEFVIAGEFMLELLWRNGSHNSPLIFTGPSWALLTAPTVGLMFLRPRPEEARPVRAASPGAGAVLPMSFSAIQAAL